MGGALSAVKLDDKSVTRAFDTTVDQDNLIKVVGRTAYVLNRGIGSLLLYDAVRFGKPIEIPTGDGEVDKATAFPQDLLPVAGTTRIYVSFFGNDAAHALGVLDTNEPTRGVVRWITLPTNPKDGDGKPEGRRAAPDAPGPLPPRPETGGDQNRGR